MFDPTTRLFMMLLSPKRHLLNWGSCSSRRRVGRCGDFSEREASSVVDLDVADEVLALDDEIALRRYDEAVDLGGKALYQRQNESPGSGDSSPFGASQPGIVSSAYGVNGSLPHWHGGGVRPEGRSSVI